jgi:hypothetical protein
MLKKHFLLAPLFACAVLMFAGAWSDRPPLAPVSSASAGAAFLAQPVSLDPHLKDLNGRRLIQRLLAELAPDKVRWLRMTTWQRQVDDEVSFESESRLVLGPDQCARLETQVQAGGQPVKSLAVSDGVVLAESLHLPGQEPQLVSQQLPAGQRDQLLRLAGCVGPWHLLRELTAQMQDLQIQTGRWNQHPVIRLTGNLAIAPSPWSLDPRVCRLYLDARTLWPHRIEWWASKQPSDPPELVLEMEFRDPVINTPLSHDDCVREFSYPADR